MQPSPQIEETGLFSGTVVYVRCSLMLHVADASNSRMAWMLMQPRVRIEFECVLDHPSSHLASAPPHQSRPVVLP